MNYINRVKSFIAAGLVALVVAQAPVAQAAGTASLTMSPSASSPTVGDTVSVAIYENGTNVNVVTAGVAYDASKLTCTGVDVSGSAFANGVSASCAGGSAIISRYVAPGTPELSGSVLVGRINLNATATGSAVLSFTGSSQIASAGVNTWNGVIGGTTVTVNSAPVAVPAAPVSVPGNTTTTNSVTVPKKTVAVATTTTTTPAQPETTGTNTKDTPQVLGVHKNTPSAKAIVATTTASDTTKVSNNITFITILLVIVAGAVVYYMYNKRNTDKKSAIHNKK